VRFFGGERVSKLNLYCLY